jgi:glycosyltransferase involved in cell wall biosynthesis
MNPRKEPKRVLHVIDSFDLGGAQTFLLDLVRHLDRTRFVPEVAAMHGHGIFECSFREVGIPTYSLSPSKFPPRFITNFWRLMRREKYDILHFHLFGANLCAKPLAIAMGHPAIVVHDQCNDALRDRNLLLLTADAIANRGASRVIAVSESVRRYLLSKEALPDVRVEMIPNGIDTQQFAPPEMGQRQAARVRLGLPEECFIIGGVGRLVAQKNFSLFLKVAAPIARRHPGVLFVIAGSGPLERVLRQEADSLGLAERVRFLGHVADRAELYHVMNVLLLPSDFEGTPMSLLEAMASRLPVVASAVDGIAEVCTDEKDALLVPHGDQAAFVRALNLLLSDSELQADLGRSARQRIQEHYEIQGVVRRIEQIYLDVLNNQGQGGDI